MIATWGAVELAVVTCASRSINQSRGPDLLIINLASMPSRALLALLLAAPEYPKILG